MKTMILFLAAALIILIFVLNLLRSRKLREKYAALWVIVGVIVIVLGIFPGLLEWFADLVGVQIPANLLFAIAIILLLAVCLQLSLEISRVEDKTRELAEHIAILNLQNQKSGIADSIIESSTSSPVSQTPGLDVDDSSAKER